MVKLKTQNSKLKTRRRGAALLVVLFMIMAVVVISLGILYRADMTAAGAQNYALRTQADYIAWAGLEHARALILADPNVPYPNINEALFSLDYDGDEVKDDFVYRLEIKPVPATYDPNEYTVTCIVYYHKDVENPLPEEPPVPRSILEATVFYNDDPAPKKAWFTNIRRPQE
jgi:hypothetical protein